MVSNQELLDYVLKHIRFFLAQNTSPTFAMMMLKQRLQQSAFVKFSDDIYVEDTINQLDQDEMTNMLQDIMKLFTQDPVVKRQLYTTMNAEMRSLLSRMHVLEVQ